MKRVIGSAILFFFVAGAQAATYVWEGTAGNNSYWTNGASWVGGVAPDPGGNHDIVLTNATAAQVNTLLGANYTIKSLTFTGGGAAMSVGNSSLQIGAGGITNLSNRTLIWNNPFFFTTAESYIVGAQQPNNTLDSTFAGGTRVNLQAFHWPNEFRPQPGSLFTTTTNVYYSLESGGPAIYSAGLNVMGSNKLFVTLADPAVNPAFYRGIGIFSTTSSNHLYFDTPIEFDAATLAPGSNRRFEIATQRYNPSGPLTTHIRGNWTQSNGPTITNTQGVGWLWLSGGGPAGNTVQSKYYYEQDSHTLVSDALADGAWGGDVYVYSGTHVINAPHAFKQNNSAFFNIGGASGGSTTVTNNKLLATSGNHVEGKIRLVGGDSFNNVARQVATVGIEGTGSVEFSGKLLLGRWAAADTLKVMNLALFAGPGGTAAVWGAISEINYSGSGDMTAGTVDVVGGGMILLGGVNTYTNTTTVRENTTLQMDGSMASEMEVLAGSTLKGGGNTTADVLIHGDFAPGASIGTFTSYADVDFVTGSTLTIELGAGDTSDLLDVTGDLDIAAATLRLVGSDTGTFTIANYGTLTGGSFFNIDTSQLSGGVTFDSIQYGSGQGSSITLTVIPEPASILLMAGGLVAAWKMRRRK